MTDQPRPLDFSEDLARHMDIDDDTATSLFAATGGWLNLSIALLRTAQSSPYDLSEIVASPGLADFVIADCAVDFDPPVDEADLCGLRVLSVLESFTPAVASVAFDAAHDSCGYFYGNRQTRTVIDRLRSAGTVLTDSQNLCVVPPLIAAWTRSLQPSTAMNKYSRLHPVLAQAFTEYVEFSTIDDPALLDNAVRLARSAREWHLLNRIALAVGLSLFYRHPALDNIETFATLPAVVRGEFPVLAAFSRLAEAVKAASGTGDEGMSPIDSHRARRIVAQLTKSWTSVIQSLHKSLNEDLTDSSTLRHVDDPGIVLETMKLLGERGEHHDAAVLGKQWTSTRVARRPRHLIALQSAIHFVHASDYDHALALLRGIDRDISDTAIAGDCLQPAVVAWTSLASYFASDHDRTDAGLTRSAGLDTTPLIMEASFRPAVLVAAAHRSLDRLDLESAATLLAQMKGSANMGDLWAQIPIVEQRLALLTAASPSELRFADEDFEDHSQTRMASSAEGERLLSSHRSIALILQGRWSEAAMLIADFPDQTGTRLVLRAFSELIGRHSAEVISLAGSSHHSRLNKCERLMLLGLKSAALLQAGHQEQAQTAFRDALETSVWAGSLFPIVMIPIIERRTLLGTVSDEMTWNRVMEKFGRPDDTDVNSIHRRLEALAPSVTTKESVPQLDVRELSMLKLMAQGKSILDIADELYLVEGTVKNRLSALYRKLGVRNRAEAVVKSRSLIGPVNL